MELVIYKMGISVSFGFLLFICYLCLRTRFELKFSKKITLLFWGISTLVFCCCILKITTNFLYFRMIYFFAVLFISTMLVFKGSTTRKIGVILLLLGYCILLDVLTFLSYAAFSIEWMNVVMPIKKYFFYAFTEILLMIGLYTPILNLIASKERVKKVSLYQNIFMLSIIALEIIIMNYLVIHSNGTNVIRMAIIGISMISVVAFDGGLIVFLDKMKKNFLLKQDLELQEQQMIMQEKYYKKVQQQYKETVNLISTMKEEILTLKQYYEDGENEKARDYVVATFKEISNSGMHYGCKDKTLAIILEDKRQICIDNGITLIVKDKILGLSFMTPFDITTIFTNLLDNAIQAVENLNQPTIKVELLSQEKMMVILIENPTSQIPVKKNGRYLSTKKEKGHGLGLKNVEKTVKKYGGSMDIQVDEGMFRVEILMPMV